jgi:phage gp16-like protein
MRVSSSSPVKLSAASAGFSRSGSGNTMSKPVTTAPSWFNLVTSSAMRVRGHGHWPYFARLFSSISTMVTGFAVFTRGWIT